MDAHSMYTFMYNQNTCIPECLITHITMIWTQYVNVDALSGYAVDWMSYYTHHSDMDAPQYEHVDELSEYFF